MSDPSLWNRIEKALAESQFDKLSIGDWETVVFCLVAEMVKYEFKQMRRSPPDWVLEMPPIQVSFTLNINPVGKPQLVKGRLRRLPDSAKRCCGEALRRMLKALPELRPEEPGFEQVDSLRKGYRSLISQTVDAYA